MHPFINFLSALPWWAWCIFAVVIIYKRVALVVACFRLGALVVGIESLLYAYHLFTKSPEGAIAVAVVGVGLAALLSSWGNKITPVRKSSQTRNAQGLPPKTITKTINIHARQVKLRDCAKCRGTGKIQCDNYTLHPFSNRGSIAYCATCNSTGMMTCYVCHGTGKGEPYV